MRLRPSFSRALTLTAPYAGRGVGDVTGPTEPTGRPPAAGNLGIRSRKTLIVYMLYRQCMNAPLLFSVFVIDRLDSENVRGFKSMREGVQGREEEGDVQSPAHLLAI